MLYQREGSRERGFSSDISGAEWSRLVDFGYKMDKNGQETPFKRLPKQKEKHP